MRDSEIVLRPVKEQGSGEFAEQILADELKQYEVTGLSV